MPNRILRDWTDSFAIDDLDVNTERFFVRLIMKVDDYGRYFSDERLLKSALFPLKTDIRVTDIIRWIAACEKSGLITTYQVANKGYLEINNFKQTLRQKKEKFPENQHLENATHLHSIRQSSDTPEYRKETESETESESENETEEKISPSFLKSDLSDKNPDTEEEKEKSCAKKEKDVLEYLNLIGGKNFKSSETNLKFIRARLKNNPIEVLKQVIEVKAYEWKEDAKMNMYLRPETLFNPTKFESYAQQVIEIKKNPQKFKLHVEQRNTELRKSAAKHYDPLDAMPD